VSIRETLEYEQKIDSMLRAVQEDAWGKPRVQQLLHQLQLADLQASLQKEVLQSMGLPSTIFFPSEEDPALEAKRVLEAAQKEVDRLESLKKPCEEAAVPSFSFRRKLEP